MTAYFSAFGLTMTTAPDFFWGPNSVCMLPYFSKNLDAASGPTPAGFFARIVGGLFLTIVASKHFFGATDEVFTKMTLWSNPLAPLLVLISLRTVQESGCVCEHPVRPLHPCPPYLHMFIHSTTDLAPLDGDVSSFHFGTLYWIAQGAMAENTDFVQWVWGLQVRSTANSYASHQAAPGRIVTRMMWYECGGCCH